jgi:hypothetical protein
MPLLFENVSQLKISIEKGEGLMDKKMRKVSKDLRKGERMIERAAKKNDKLASYDKKIRDPQIERLHKIEKKGACRTKK